MTCDEVREVFSECYDDLLSGDRLMDVTRHLDECSDCRAEWASFSMTLQVVTQLGMADPSPEFAARVRQRIETPPWWRRLARTLFFPLHVKVPIHAVALAVLSFAGLMLIQRSPDLRREVEVQVAPPAPSVPQARPSGSLSPAPPIPEKPARAKTAAKRPEPSPPAERAKSPAAPPAALAPLPPPPASLEKKERRSSPQLERPPEPKLPQAAKSPQSAAGSSGGLKVQEEDLRPPAGRLQQAPPIPAPSQDAARSAAPMTSLAPSRAERAPSAPSGSADELFSAAVTEYARQDYERAIQRFRAFLAAFPGDARAPDARFFLGEAQFSRQRYREAIPEFETLIRQFPESRRIPAALYRQGQARLALGDQAGCQLLRDVTTLYSQTREAASAREVLSARCP
ncbi:MAG TPA: tetratricopeptide repeat protein [Candidatus Acidoferrum sp.]|nr:tetratricopeptide repeat protein [Candidatus Acidoferrum sp.]